MVVPVAVTLYVAELLKTGVKFGLLDHSYFTFGVVELALKATVEAVQAAMQAFGAIFMQELAQEVQVESGSVRGLSGEQAVVLLEKVFELVGVRLFLHVLTAVEHELPFPCG